jgi:hypothetical protein
MKRNNYELATKVKRLNANLKILIQKERDAIVPEKRSPSLKETAPALHLQIQVQQKSFKTRFWI